MLFLRSILFVLVLSHYFFSPIFAGSTEEEEFSEELLLKPLPDRKVLAHFHFDSRAPPSTSHGRHHRLFPKAIAQLVQKFRIREMELSFTQGRWNYEQWGGFDPVSSANAKPPGVELWAVFDVPSDQVDSTWKNLTHTLAGLFCASINFLESSTAYASPHWSFRPFLGALRYGALPREAVCTENLTPWLKLLPCRDKAGLAVLMDRPSIYRGFYHSQRLRLTSSETDSEVGVERGISLEQTLTVVLQPGEPQPSWSLSSIFGRKITGKCELAKSSTVFIGLERNLVSELNESGKKNEKNWVAEKAYGSWSNPVFQLSFSPDRVIEEINNGHGGNSAVLYEFSTEKYSDYEPFDVSLTWKQPVFWSSPQAPFHTSRFLMGSGNARGSIAITLKSTELVKGFLGDSANKGSCKVRIEVFQVVPWYVKVYFHTLRIFVDGEAQIVSETIEKIRVSPSEDRVSPGLMEMLLRLPCDMKSGVLTIEFDKGLLHIDEYPPDANQGFDIPSAVISFPDFEASMHFLKEDSSKSPLLSKFQEKNPVLSYTEILLVPLATPDFSMPYNVITITCTVFALYFGSLLNVLRRRVAEEERFLKSQASGKGGPLPRLLSKLLRKLRGRPEEPSQSQSPSSSLLTPKFILKVLLVAGIAVGWHFYSE
ncbi:GPI transamidase component PIG-T [Macadamia integrifolia]|uniref:GPI transamidase component PIG-T n=1 Tax=Macadamia integrifolia TaxID=60698 RepID=UPI001C4FFA7F|nr:GPI transamidase component PIG-T [Macadamia integrifolia]XP_042516141.1 GPI transamidase component PIG-T [Macadamia integrifolia]